MGVIESRIFDSLGRELPGVRIDLFNENGKRINTDVTPTQDGRPTTPGRYRFDNLAPGKYTIKAVGRGLDGYNRPDETSVHEFTIIDDFASIGEAQIMAKIQDGTLETQEGALLKANLARDEAKAASRPITWTPSAEDVGARPDNWMPTVEDIGARPDSWTPSKADLGLGNVENKSSSTIRSELTTANVTNTGLSASDIGAETPAGAQAKANTAETNAKAASRPVTWTPSAEDIGARPDNWMPTVEDIGARPDSWTPSKADVGLGNVENKSSVTIRSEITKTNVTATGLTASDVGARPDSWIPSKSDLGLGNVENKSSATIRSELTKANVTSTGLSAGDIGAETPAGAQAKANTAEANAKNEITSRGLTDTGDFTGKLNGIHADKAFQTTYRNIELSDWYRLATNSGNRAHARFLVQDKTSGRHGTVEFSLGVFYNIPARASFVLLSAGRYGAQTIRKVRLLTKTTYDTMYVDIYCETGGTGTIALQIQDNYQSYGWTIADGLPDAAIPDGYNVREWTTNLDDVAQPNNQLTKANVTATGIAASDIGAETPADAQVKANTAEANAKAASRPVSWMPSASEVGARADTWLPTKSQIELGNVENKSSSMIRSELTKANVTNTGLAAGDIGAETPAGAQAKANTAEANAKAASRPVTWTPSVEEVGADPAGSAATAEANAKVASRPATWIPSAAEIGARPDNWIPDAEDVGARPDTWLPSKSDLGLGSVENKSSATIRSEITKTNVTATGLTASDVGARPDSWTPSKSDLGLGNVDNKSSAVIRSEITKLNVTSTGLAAADIGAETPAGAQAKADTAEANAKSASRPVTWTPTAAEVGARPDNWMPTKSQIGLGNVSNFSPASMVGAGITRSHVTGTGIDLDDIHDGTSYKRVTASEKIGGERAYAHLDTNGLKGTATIAGETAASVVELASRKRQYAILTSGAQPVWTVPKQAVFALLGSISLFIEATDQSVQFNCVVTNGGSYVRLRMKVLDHLGTVKIVGKTQEFKGKTGAFAMGIDELDRYFTPGEIIEINIEGYCDNSGNVKRPIMLLA